MCLRTTNFTTRGLDLTEVRYVDAETYQRQVQRLVPEAGDIVYSREGGILGIACTLPEGPRVCLGQRMMLLRPNREVVLPEFLVFVLNSPATLAVVRDLTGGTASPHLNVGEVKQFQVPLPPIPKQQEIVRRVEALFALADAIEQHIAAVRARAEGLTQAVLAKAFRGELVPTEAELARREGRDYEPASVLLERIRTGRADGHASQPQRRPRRGSPIVVPPDSRAP